MAKKLVATKEDVVEFAEDLGRLLGTARGKADKWLAQRRVITKNLQQIRDTATELLNDLGHQAERTLQSRRARRVRRRMSAKARALISVAQKSRWAKLKAAVKKK